MRPICRAVALKDIVSVQNGFAFDSERFNVERLGMPIVRIRDLAKGKSKTFYDGEYDKRYVVGKGDFLIGMDGEFRCYRWSGPDSLLNQRVCRLQNFGPEVVPSFVFHGINKHLERIEGKTDFVTVKHLSSKQIEAIRIPLPSLPEQRRIVRVLDETEELRRLRAEADRRTADLVPAIFYDMFGDPATNPKGWPIKQLSEVGTLDRGRSRHRPRDAPHLYGGPFPFVQTGDVANAKGVIREYSQTYSEEGLNQSKLWPAGTLCITIAANIAKTATLGFDACFPDSMAGFVPGAQADVEYVREWLETVAAKLEEEAPQAAQKNINLKILRGLAIPLPPLPLQRTFAARVAEVRAMEAEQAQSRRRLDDLFQSLLHETFDGEL